MSSVIKNYITMAQRSPNNVGAQFQLTLRRPKFISLQWRHSQSCLMSPIIARACKLAHTGKCIEMAHVIAEEESSELRKSLPEEGAVNMQRFMSSPPGGTANTPSVCKRL